MKRAADTLTPVSLELGGKDPMIVLTDANMDRAVNGAAFGGLANTGQICMSIERVYVEEPIYDEFVQAHRAGRELRQGDDGRTYSRRRRDDVPGPDRDRLRPRRGRPRQGRPDPAGGSEATARATGTSRP